MKNIKAVKLDKYNSENYNEIAFDIYYNKISKNYCFCFEADKIDQYPLEDLLDQYSVNCTEHCGQNVIINGEEKNIAEVETLSEEKGDLIKILNFSTIIGKEIINITYNGYELLGINYSNSNIVVNNAKISVPIFANRRDRSGMASFNHKYPEIQYKNLFTSEKNFNLEINNFNENNIKFILLQNNNAKIIYEDGSNIIEFKIDLQGNIIK